MAHLVVLHQEAAAPIKAWIAAADWGRGEMQAEPSLGASYHPAFYQGLLTVCPPPHSPYTPTYPDWPEACNEPQNLCTHTWPHLLAPF